MHPNFIFRPGGPDRLMAEAELIFDDHDGPLSGLRLVGFSLWQGNNRDEFFVTFPSRAFGVGTERRFFDYLRGDTGDAEVVKRFKGFLIDAFVAARENGKVATETAASGKGAGRKRRS